MRGLRNKAPKGAHSATQTKDRPCPRYYFHIRNHIDTVDFIGAELKNLDAAYKEALKDIADIISAKSDKRGLLCQITGVASARSMRMDLGSNLSHL